MKSIVESEDVRVIAAGGVTLYVTFTFNELRTISRILHLEFETSPPSTIVAGGVAQSKTYLGRTCGMTLYIDTGASTTLTTKAIGIGW